MALQFFQMVTHFSMFYNAHSNYDSSRVPAAAGNLRNNRVVRVACFHHLQALSRLSEENSWGAAHDKGRRDDTQTAH